MLSEERRKRFRLDSTVGIVAVLSIVGSLAGSEPRRSGVIVGWGSQVVGRTKRPKSHGRSLRGERP